MQPRRRESLGALLAVASLPVTRAFAQSEDYPNRAIRFVVPYAAGGAVDIMARAIARDLTMAVGQSVVVDNKGGAGGAIAAREVAHATPDGYTVLVGAAGPNAIAPAVQSNVGFDPIRDFSPVSLIATSPYVLVIDPALPVKTVPELIAYARAKPGQLNFASSGTGGPDHLAGELFAQMTGIAATHIPYKGGALALADLAAGRVQWEFISPLPAMPMVEAGKLRLIAVTSATRVSVMPAVPTVAESVPGFEVTPWYGLFLPGGARAAIVQRLNVELHRVMASDELRRVFVSRGLEPRTSTSDEFASFVRQEFERWTGIVRKAGIKA